MADWNWDRFDDDDDENEDEEGGFQRVRLFELLAFFIRNYK